MLVLFLFLPFCFAVPREIKCDNQTINLGDNSTFSIPSGTYSNQLCVFKILFPEETYVEIKAETVKAKTLFHDWIYVVDSMNHQLDILSQKNSIFAGSHLKLVIDTRASFYNVSFLYHFKLTTFILKNISITLHPFSIFNKTKYFPIEKGSQQLVIDTRSLETGTTYIFEGFPNLAAAFLSNDKNVAPSSIAEKLFVYGGSKENSTYLGSIAKWKDKVQYFETLSVYVVGPLEKVMFKKSKDELLVVLPSSKVSDFSNPRFVQASDFWYTTYRLDASKKPTFLTVTQHENEAYLYSIVDFSLSEDAELVLLDGFATLDFKKSDVIERFKAKDIDALLFVMILARTKSIVLLKGKLTMSLVQVEDVKDSLGFDLDRIFFVRGEDNFPVIKWKADSLYYDKYQVKVDASRDRNDSSLSLNITNQISSKDYEKHTIQLERAKTEHSEMWTAQGIFKFALNGKGNVKLSIAGYIEEPKTTTSNPFFDNSPTTSGYVGFDCPRFQFFECFFS